MKKPAFVLLTLFTVLVTLQFSARASAEPALKLSSAITSALLPTLNSNMAFATGTNQGWIETKVEIGCYDPQGTDNSADQQFCHLSALRTQYVASVNQPTLTKDLMVFFLAHQDRFFLGMGQGWDGYGGVLTCFAPAGTGNSADQAYCEISEMN